MTDNFPHPEWSYTSNIYEVNVRQYTREGTFEAFEKHLPRLKDMGEDRRPSSPRARQRGAACPPHLEPLAVSVPRTLATYVARTRATST